MGKIVIAGGTGFLGRELSKELDRIGNDVVVLGRSQNAGEWSVTWNGRFPGDWTKHLDGSDAVINLSGSPVFVPWTQSNRDLILTSRLETTHAIGKAIAASSSPPKLWINASAVGFYGDRGDQLLEESSSCGKGFLADVCEQCENAAQLLKLSQTRVASLRIGVVLGRNGGAFPKLRLLTRVFLGGALGNGRQWIPWIHSRDLVNLILWVVDHDFRGPVNAVGPNAVRNADLMRAMRAAFARPWSPPVPEWALALGSKLGAPDPSILLYSARATPKVAMDGGFEFEFPTIEDALADLARLK